MSVAACSGAPVAESGGGDGGEGESEGGPGRAVEGGAWLVRSSANPYGAGDVGDGGAPFDGSFDAMPHAHGDAAWVTAVPPGMPQVVDSNGPTLKSPVMQAITFSNYELTPYMDDFVAKVGATDYWQAAVSEYGVGTASAVAPVHLGYGAPTSIDDVTIQSWLAGEIASDPAVMKPTSDSVYVVFYPYSTNVTFQGLQSCFTMGAYHNSFVANGANVAYAVIPECTPTGKSTLQATTSATSHELVEVATDPFPLTTTMTAYGGVDADHLYFQTVFGGGEVGDMCAQWPSSFFVPSGMQYMVQRTWSNVAAVAGHDPCRPALPNEVYFNAVPRLTETVPVTTQGVTYPTKGTRIAIGASKTIDVQLYSEDDIGTWSVEALSVPTNGYNLAFDWDRNTGQNGDTLHLTIHVNGANDGFGGEPFLLKSSQGSATNYWVGYVGQ